MGEDGLVVHFAFSHNKLEPLLTPSTHTHTPHHTPLTVFDKKSLLHLVVLMSLQSSTAD